MNACLTKNLIPNSPSNIKFMKLTMQVLPLMVLIMSLRADIDMQPTNNHRVVAAEIQRGDTPRKGPKLNSKVTRFGCSDTYDEKGGLVIMEMENTTSDLDLWIKKTDMPDYRGSGHLEFTGNKITSGPPKSPLEYKFKINTAGEYRLWLRAHKRLETDREDLSNDCFVREAGDFTEGTGFEKGYEAFWRKSRGMGSGYSA